jgi:P4 family phage/plasmid primase-like protien
MSIRITHGLYTTHTNNKVIHINELEQYLEAHTDVYELPNDICRVYVDIDGKYNDCDRNSFLTLDRTIKNKLDFDPDNWCLMYSSQYQCDGVNKLSYRLVCVNKYGTKQAIAEYVRTKIYKLVKQLLTDIIDVKLSSEAGTEFYGLVIDTSVYTKNRKMRMLGQSKPNQNRPFETDSPITNTVISFIPNDAIEIKETPKQVKENIQQPDTVVSTDLIKKILNGLDIKRADNYEDWLKIGMILFNYGIDVKLWDEWSKQSILYNPGDCENKYKTFNKGDLSIASLYHMLKADNITLFNEITKEQRADTENIEFFNIIAVPSHAIIADYYYSLYPSNYLFNNDLGWYELDGFNKWIHTNKTPIGLISHIWETFKDIIDKHKKYTNCAGSDIEKERYRLLTGFNKMIGHRSFTDGVCEFLKCKYNNTKLAKLMNENRNIFAFDDCCYDFTIKAYRPITPADYVSITCGYNRPQYSEADTETLNTLLYSLFESEEMVKYLLSILADRCAGYIRKEHFTVWTGSGGNGKGVLTSLLQSSFGNYMRIIPHTVLTTNKQRQSDATPHLCAQGVRILMASEPEADEPLQTGTIKLLTGGDTITARRLYSEPISYIPQFGLILQTNDIPSLSALDGGIIRRLQVVKFPFQFVETPEQQHQRKINTDIKNTILRNDRVRDAFISMLLQSYGVEIQTPTTVKQETTEYIENNNQVKIWIESNYNTGQDPNNKDYYQSSSLLLQHYQYDTKDTNMTKMKFSTLMKNAGYVSKRMGIFMQGSTRCSPGIYWVGLQPIE